MIMAPIYARTTGRVVLISSREFGMADRVLAEERTGDYSLFTSYTYVTPGSPPGAWVTRRTASNCVRRGAPPPAPPRSFLTERGEKRRGEKKMNTF